jgi:hypothetical protein
MQSMMTSLENSIHEIFNLIIVAVLYSGVSILSCAGIVFFIFIGYVRKTYVIARSTRQQMEKEEVQLIKLSDQIVDCSEKLRSLYSEKKTVKITIIPNNIPD